MSDLKRASPFVISLILHALVFFLAFQHGGGDGNGKGDKSGDGDKQSQENQKEHDEGSNEDIVARLQSYLLGSTTTTTTTMPVIEVDMIEGTTTTTTLPKKPTEEKKDEVAGVEDCEGKNWYGGVGISNWDLKDGTFLITEVAPGYPAAKAGLQVGDVIIHPPSGAIRGPIGTIVVVTVRKLGKDYTETIPMIRQKICTKAAQPKPEKPNGH